MKKTIFDLKKELETKKEERKKMKEDYESSLSNLDSEILEIKESIDEGIKGLDINKMSKGKDIVYISGKLNSSERKDCIKDAIDDLLLNKGNYLKECFIGVKNYSGFGDQGCNCGYGMGPKHGGIVFEVGMYKKYREKENMTEEELESAIYYLSNTLKEYNENE